MSTHELKYTGRWLHDGDRHGSDFTHVLPEYEHPGTDSGITPMRHASIETMGQTVGVWVPAHWSDDEARAALENNW